MFVRLERLLERADQLLDRIEPLLPPRAKTDWSARAFRWRRRLRIGYLEPIYHPHPLRLDDLQGIERQKGLLLRNTRQFVAGLPANNALLTGSRGTGKSSLVKALLTELGDRGLRLIEVDRQGLSDLHEIVAPLRDRPERFILYTDDLSFEAEDPSYKALKAILDGSLARAPGNVLIYATSNRRHLLPEYLRENREARYHEEGEIHQSEAVEEKISLSERFGLWLTFYPFKQEEYLVIVEHWLARLGTEIDEAARAEALRYALQRGSRSGRVAQQFARDWAGRQGLESL